MFEVGQKVVCVSTSGYGWLSVGKIYTVDSLWRDGIYFVDDKDDLVGMNFGCFEPHTETEAERRGAEFGVMGVVRQSGIAVIFISDKHHQNGLGEALWTVVNEDGDVYPIHPVNIRLDHEPEFVAWSEAPEHLRYDASRVYYDGEPVKWIAKPEGTFTDVVVVQENGIMEFSTHKLTVKL